jgi:hypothetical protein
VPSPGCQSHPSATPTISAARKSKVEEGGRRKNVFFAGSLQNASFEMTFDPRYISIQPSEQLVRDCIMKSLVLNDLFFFPAARNHCRLLKVHRNDGEFVDTGTTMTRGADGESHSRHGYRRKEVDRSPQEIFTEGWPSRITGLADGTLFSLFAINISCSVMDPHAQFSNTLSSSRGWNRMHATDMFSVG